MTPALAAAARRIWLGRPDPGDADAVRPAVLLPTKV